MISLVFTLWKPISSYFAGSLVGGLFAAAAYYIWVRMFLSSKAEETAIEEWIDFPALEAMLAKIDKEDKNTSLQVCSTRCSSVMIHRDDDVSFFRLPALRLPSNDTMLIVTTTSFVIRVNCVSTAIV